MSLTVWVPKSQTVYGLRNLLRNFRNLIKYYFGVKEYNNNSQIITQSHFDLYLQTLLTYAMCRNLYLAFNIQTTSIDDIFKYLNRRFRLWCILSVVNIAELFLLGDGVGLNLAFFHTLAFVLNTIFLGGIIHSKHHDFVLLGNLGTIVVTILTIANGVFVANDDYPDIQSLSIEIFIVILSTLLSLSTIYILHHLRQKMLQPPNDNDDSYQKPLLDDNIERPDFP